MAPDREDLAGRYEEYLRESLKKRGETKTTNALFQVLEDLAESGDTDKLGAWQEALNRVQLRSESDRFDS